MKLPKKNYDPYQDCGIKITSKYIVFLLWQLLKLYARDRDYLECYEQLHVSNKPPMPSLVMNELAKDVFNDRTVVLV